METEQNNENPQVKDADNKTTMMVAGAVVVVLVLIGGFLLLSNNNKQAPTPSPVATETISSPSPNPTGEVDSSQIIAVEGGNFYYKPNEITVKAGKKVTIEFSAKGMMHDFVVDELNVKSPVIQAGKTATVEFTPTTPGEYEFYCSVSNHRAQGMKGTLIVE